MRRSLALVIALFACSPAVAGGPNLQKAGGGSAVDQIRAADAQSDDWDDAVEAALLSEFDANSSGRLDTPSELKALDCNVWRAIDTGVKAKWDGTGARVIYGFAKRFGWVGGAWGFDEKLRKKADKAMASCGLSD